MLNRLDTRPLTAQEVEKLLSELPPMCKLGDLQNAPELKISWTLEGLLPDGYLIFLASKGKTGKTTFIVHLLKAMMRGDPTFLGLKLQRRRTVLISEEDRRLWRTRLIDTKDDAGLLDLMCKPYFGRPGSDQWLADCIKLARIAPSQGIQLVVIDPMANLMPGDENTAGAALDFLAPLDALTSQGISVVVLHHPNKSGSDPLRGSSAILGKLDVRLEMKRPGGDPQTRCRSIYATCRDGIGCLEELHFELSDDGQGYRVLADASEAIATGLTPPIRRFLASVGEGRTAEEIRAECDWPDGKRPHMNSLHNALKRGLDKHWRREGSDRAGSPYRYQAITTKLASPLIQTP